MDSYEALADLDLVKQASGGDELAFGEIVRRFSPRVFRFAGKFFRQRSLVEEAAQEVFLKAFTQLKNFEGRGSLEGWLTRITTNTCLNLLRSAKRQPEIADAVLTDDETEWLESKSFETAKKQFQASEQKLVAADLVNRVLDTLPPADRLVLLMIDGEGASVKDVVEVTGWSESKVKVQAFRARRRMRQAVEKLLKQKTQPLLTELSAF